MSRTVAGLRNCKGHGVSLWSLRYPVWSWQAGLLGHRPRWADEARGPGRDPQAATQLATASGPRPTGSRALRPGCKSTSSAYGVSPSQALGPDTGTVVPAPARSSILLARTLDADGGPRPGLDPNPHVRVCDESCAPLPLALREPGRGLSRTGLVLSRTRWGCCRGHHRTGVGRIK